MFVFLRSIDLDPIEWSEAVAMTGKASPYVGEILEAALNNAQAVVVVMTPDDEAQRPGSQLPRRRRVPRSHRAGHVGRGIGRVQGVRHPLELHADDRGRHDPTKGVAGSQLS